MSLKKNKLLRRCQVALSCHVTTCTTMVFERVGICSAKSIHTLSSQSRAYIGKNILLSERTTRRSRDEPDGWTILPEGKTFSILARARQSYFI